MQLKSPPTGEPDLATADPLTGVKLMFGTESGEGVPVGRSLTAAAFALLGSVSTADAQVEEASKWAFDTALMFYGESDGRVQDVSANFQGSRQFSDSNAFTGTLAVDTLTGATPTGALPSASAQTFTRPSGSGSYTVAPGETPLDDSFLDTRVAISASWLHAFNRLLRSSVGLSVSSEYDYQHFGVNGRIARDFNQRNTTLELGVGFATDTFDPVGGVPLGLSPMIRAGDGDDDDGGGNTDPVLAARAAEEDKTVTDVLLGLTQVISRRFLVQANVGVSISDGYLNDPYKLLTVSNPITGEAVLQSNGLGMHLYENRPDTRTKNTFYLKGKYHFDTGILDAAYRYHTDDWQVNSHTVDLRYQWDLDKGRSIEPHVRFYTQSAAEFYRLNLLDGEPLPTFASADYRLGEFDATTFGVQYRQRLRNGAQFNARLELYQQRNVTPAPSAASLQQFDLNPDLQAIILQVGYRFGG